VLQDHAAVRLDRFARVVVPDRSVLHRYPCGIVTDRGGGGKRVAQGQSGPLVVARRAAAWYACPGANMTALILSSSPNTDGLTAACVDAVRSGLNAGGVDAHEVRLTDANVGVCRQCSDGWGTCRSDHVCQVADGFQAVHARVSDADALIVVTPVYWGDLSESAKAFVDRLRRCEATAGDESVSHPSRSHVGVLPPRLWSFEHGCSKRQRRGGMAPGIFSSAGHNGRREVDNRHVSTILLRGRAIVHGTVDRRADCHVR
jgi:hypothetical protein